MTTKPQTLAELEENLYEWATAIPISAGMIQWRSLGDVYQFARLLGLAGMGERGETTLQLTLRLLAGIQLGLDPLRSIAAMQRFGGQIRPGLSWAIGKLYALHPEARITFLWQIGGQDVDCRPSKLERGSDAVVTAYLDRTGGLSEEPTAKAARVAHAVWAERETYSLAEAEREGLLDGPADSWWRKNTAHAMETRALSWLLRRSLPGAYELRDGWGDSPAAALEVKASPRTDVEPMPAARPGAVVPDLRRALETTAGTAPQAPAVTIWHGLPSLEATAADAAEAAVVELERRGVLGEQPKARPGRKPRKRKAQPGSNLSAYCGHSNGEAAEDDLCRAIEHEEPEEDEDEQGSVGAGDEPGKGRPRAEPFPLPPE